MKLHERIVCQGWSERSLSPEHLSDELECQLLPQALFKALKDLHRKDDFKVDTVSMCHCLGQHPSNTDHFFLNVLLLLLKAPYSFTEKSWGIFSVCVASERTTDGLGFEKLRFQVDHSPYLVSPQTAGL